jgi:phage tail-like protein
MAAISGTSMGTSSGAGKLVSANRFVVQIDGSTGVGSSIAFSELAGITSEVEPAEYYSSSQVAGVNLTKQYGKVKPATITLKRGVDDDQSLWRWHNRVVIGDPTARATCSLLLQNTARQTQASYQLINAWPSKLDVAGMKAGASEVLIASCTLVCDQILIPGVTGS